MIVDKIVALLDGLDSTELDQMPPARRQKFAALCHHWAQLAERRQKEPKSGVLSKLKDGERSD